jgi:hypothetical protein
MSEAIPPLPNTPSWRDAQLKHKDSESKYNSMKAYREHEDEAPAIQTSALSGNGYSNFTLWLN